MSTPDFEVHRAIVHSSNPVTGEASVRIPSLLGAGQVVNIPTTGLTNSDGFWNVPSAGSSVFVAVSVDRTQFLWLTAIGISGSGGDTPSNEPIGHEDRTGSLIAFDNATRTFSIQPVNNSYVIWCVGLRYEKTSLESIQIPNTTGLYYISFNAQGQLQYSTDYFVWDQDCPTAYVYWNSTTQRAEFFADERHGITMDWQTHEYLHRTRGAAYANGFDASNFDTSTQNGNTDAQAKLDIDNGTFFDEDLQVDVRHSLAPAQNTWEQQLQGPARIPVFYRSGTSYVYDAPTDFPVKQGTTHPRYNSSSGGNWSTIELGANTYGIQWIVATNQLNYPILSIMGQTQYANVGQAEAASWADMDLDGLPIVEIRVLYKIIFRATGSNTPGCYFEQIDDYRNALSNATSTAASVVDHGNLTGLGDDDHPQYLTSSRADLLYADINASPTITLAGNATGSVTLTDLGDGTLTVTVVNDSHSHSNYVAKNTSYEWTSGQLTFRSADVLESASGDQATLEVYQDTAGADAFMQFHVAGDYAMYFGLKGDINDFAVGGWSKGANYYRVWHAGNDGSGSGLDADLLDGLELHTGRNNEANKVVRTDGNGYIQAGWINTPSGNHTGTVTRITASNDDYLRYVTPAHFRSQVTDGYYYGSSSSVRALWYQGYGNSEVTAYQTSGNWQTWTGGWATHIICNHGDGSNYYNQTLIMPFWGVPGYMRKTGGANSGPYTFWSTENAGSGIDWNTAATIATVNGSSAFYYNQALQTRSTGQRGGVGMWADNSNNSAVQLRPSGGYLYVRSWNDGTGIIMRAATYENYSTIKDKQDVTDWGASKSVGAAVDPSYAIDALEMVRNLRPVKFRRTKHHRLSADLQNHNERRAKALDRLNVYRRSRGMDDYVTDETVHQCGRDCGGTPENPCKLYRDWEKGEVGFIAEEVVNVIPDAVGTDDDEQPLTISPMALIATCVKALQEIDTRLASLEAGNA